jgi:molybdenum cofactor synthesis domain-containing protein
MQNKRIYTAAALIIGNEVLSGRTADANLNYMAKRLTDLGIRLMEARVIPDVMDTIVDAVNECRAAFDYLFTTGGIGPTHDDITAEAVARAFGVPIERNPEIVRILESYIPAPNLNEARLKMADFPKGAELLFNEVSRAPGFRIDNVYVMAGVPSIMRSMFDGFAGALAGGDRILSITVAAELPEGAVASGLSDIQNRHPEVEIGSYPSYNDGKFKTSLVSRGTDPAGLAAAVEEIRDLIRTHGVEPIEEA